MHTIRISLLNILILNVSLPHIWISTKLLSQHPGYPSNTTKRRPWSLSLSLTHTHTHTHTQIVCVCVCACVYKRVLLCCIDTPTYMHRGERSMRPGNLSRSAEFHVWHSPLPYLLIGLAAMMGLIAIALIVLAYSHRKSSGGGSSSTLETENPVVLAPLEREPKVLLVIMAGDDMPRFLAKPFGLLESSETVASLLSLS